MTSFLGDMRLAVKALRKSPGFALVAVSTLGLGIAANTTVFGWVDTVLLRPIRGVEAAERLSVLEAVSPEGSRIGQTTHPDFREYQRQMTTAEGVVATHIGFFTLGPADQSRRVMGQVVSANYFPVLGVKAHLGRLFTADMDEDSPGAYPVAVVSHRFWRSYYREDPAAVGQTLRINGHPYTVMGVADKEFGGTFAGATFDVWVPLSRIIQTGTLNTWAVSDWNGRFLDVVVKRKPGVSVEQAREEARAIAARISAAHPDTHRGVGATVLPMWKANYGLHASLGKPLRILMIVCLLVMMIACANVANLLMAKSVSRQREFGIRIALGAGRAPLYRQLLAEAGVLAATGAAAGLALSQWMGEWLVYALPAFEAPVQTVIEPLLQPQLNGLTLLFVGAATALTTMFAALLPAIHAGRVDVNETLKEGGRSGGSGQQSHRARSALVVAEVALSAFALVGAGLAFRSFERQSKLSLGFEPKGVLTAHFHLSTNGYSLEREKQFNRDLRLRLETTPGIEAVSSADAIPLSVYGSGSDRVQAYGGKLEEQGVIPVTRSIVAPGYFRLMGIPLIEGRDFTEDDDRKRENAIIVNQAFARKFLGEGSPVGRRLRVSGSWATVVGLVKDSKYRSPSEEPLPYFHESFGQMFWSGHNHFLLIRARDLNVAREALRREVAALDPKADLFDEMTLEECTEAGLMGERVTASLLSALGLMALALVSAGVYAVMAYAVSERRQEMGIRMALGASRVALIGMVLRRGLALTAAGLGAGVLALTALSQLMANELDAPAAADIPLVVFGTILVLVATTAAASFFPARRASRVDPMITLRSE
jgi:predicted permease